MEKTATTTTAATATNGKPRSLCLTKYIRNIQQANKRTALEYEYRLSKFEKYIEMYQQNQQQHNQDQKIEAITSFDQVIKELKKNSNNNKIDPYDLLSGFVAYIQEEQKIENPNTIRYFVITARNFLEYHDIEISPPQI